MLSTYLDAMSRRRRQNHSDQRSRKINHGTVRTSRQNHYCGEMRLRVRFCNDLAMPLGSPRLPVGCFRCTPATGRKVLLGNTTLSRYTLMRVLLLLTALIQQACSHDELRGTAQQNSFEEVRDIVMNSLKDTGNSTSNPSLFTLLIVGQDSGKATIRSVTYGVDEADAAQHLLAKGGDSCDSSGFFRPTAVTIPPPSVAIPIRYASCDSVVDTARRILSQQSEQRKTAERISSILVLIERQRGEFTANIRRLRITQRQTKADVVGISKTTTNMEQSQNEAWKQALQNLEEIRQAVTSQ